MARRYTRVVLVVKRQSIGSGAAERRLSPIRAIGTGVYSRMPIDRNQPRGRMLLTGAALAGVPAIALAAAHPATAASVFARVEATVVCATSSACVAGSNTSTGPGVWGSSTSGYGVSGSSTSSAGVHGASTTNVGVVGATEKNATSAGSGSYGVAGYDRSTNNNTFSSGVYGTSTAAFGVQGYSVSNVGVYGNSSTGLGVYGVASGPGVYGVSASNDGAGGATNSANDAGVAGSSQAGEGGYFESTATTALEAVNSNTGNPMTSTAIAATTNGDAVDLFNSTRAILGTNANGDGAEFAGSYIGLIGRSPTTGYPMDLVDENYNNLFLVDGYGNATVAANLTVLGTLNGAVRTAEGSRVSAFVAKTAAPTIEDTGTAQLSDGGAAVRLDPAFASSIDSRQSYRVFVTPDGDTNGLYVAAKTASGFVVREIHGGRSTLAFDYRIVATAWGEAGRRSAVMTGSPMAAHVRAVKLPKSHTRIRADIFTRP
jgi:hypothetical protein